MLLKSETHFLLKFLKSETHSVLSVLWNALPYIGKFDGQARLGTYGLTATCGHNNTTQALQPCCFEHKYGTHTLYNVPMAALRLRPIYSCGQSTVAVNLRLRPIYSYGQSTVAVNVWLWPIYGYRQSMVAANLRLQPIYGCGHSILLLWPLCPLQLQLCYI